MAIKISNNTIIDDNRNIVDAGIATAIFFDGYVPGSEKEYTENTTIDNQKTNVALESDLVIGSGITFTVSTGSTVILNPFDFDSSSVDELLIHKQLSVGVSSSFDTVSSGVGSVGISSTKLVGFGSDLPPNIEVGLLVKPIPGIISVGTTIVSFVASASTTAFSTVTINPASINTEIQEDVTFKFGSYGEKESNIILDGENGNIILNEYANILDSAGYPYAPLGNIVSVATTAEVVTTTTTWTDTSLAASIIPSSINSQILVIINQSMYVLANTQGVFGGLRLLRNDTVIHDPVRDVSGPYNVGLQVNENTNLVDSVELASSVNYILLDSPKSTSPITYKTQQRIYVAGNNANITSQLDGGNSFDTSYITLIEIRR